jgi:hypothetical protein
MMVDLDSKLLTIEPWSEVARTLEALIKASLIFSDLTISLRPATVEEKARLQRERNTGALMTVADKGRRFEFAFDLESQAPPRKSDDLMSWVDSAILDRVDQYFDELAGEEDDELLLGQEE